MKIFNWMHRKLQRSNDYCKVSHMEEKEYFRSMPISRISLNPVDTYKFTNFEHETKMGEIEKKALLLEPGDLANLHQALDYTILSIGTLGCYHDNFYNMEEEDDDDEEGEWVSETHHGAPTSGEYCSSESQKQEQQESTLGRKPKAGKNNDNRKNEKPVKPAAMMDPAVQKVPDAAGNEEKLLEPLLKKKVDHVGRTTLLDLFRESDGLTRKRTTASCHIQTSNGETKDVAVDGMASSYAKKLASRKRKDKNPSPPISKKLRQLATKMMRKKIHPEAKGEISPVQKQAPERLLLKHENKARHLSAVGNCGPNEGNPKGPLLVS